MEIDFKRTKPLLIVGLSCELYSGWKVISPSVFALRRIHLPRQREALVLCKTVKQIPIWLIEQSFDSLCFCKKKAATFWVAALIYFLTTNYSRVEKCLMVRTI